MLEQRISYNYCQYFAKVLKKGNDLNKIQIYTNDNYVYIGNTIHCLNAFLKFPTEQKLDNIYLISGNEFLLACTSCNKGRSLGIVINEETKTLEYYLENNLDRHVKKLGDSPLITIRSIQVLNFESTNQEDLSSNIVINNVRIFKNAIYNALNALDKDYAYDFSQYVVLRKSEDDNYIKILGLNGHRFICTHYENPKLYKIIGDEDIYLQYDDLLLIKDLIDARSSSTLQITLSKERLHFQINEYLHFSIPSDNPCIFYPELKFNNLFKNDQYDFKFTCEKKELSDIFKPILTGRNKRDEKSIDFRFNKSSNNWEVCYTSVINGQEFVREFTTSKINRKVPKKFSLSIDTIKGKYITFKVIDNIYIKVEDVTDTDLDIIVCGMKDIKSCYKQEAVNE